MFGPKHRLWVLDRNSLSDDLSFEEKILKISFFPGEIFHFYMSKHVCVLHGQVFAQALEVITINH